MQKVKRAVILAAGLGTRMLPIARTVPKEMLPVVDRPAFDYLVAEAAASGIEDILVITNRGKESIEDYFDYSPEYEQHLGSKEGEIARLREPAERARVYFLRQKTPKGTGHALLCAEAFAAGEPVAVMYGDDFILSKRPVLAQLADAWEKYGQGVCGVKAVSDELVMKYCTLDAHPRHDGTFEVRDMIEKPTHAQIITNYSVLGRLILPPKIFDILRDLPRGANGEYQITDAMGVLSRSDGMTAVDFEGTRFDLGSKIGLLEANIAVGLTHPETAEELRAYIEAIVHK